MNKLSLCLSLNSSKLAQAAESRKLSTATTSSSSATLREDRRDRVNQAQHYCHLHLASLGDRPARRPPAQVPVVDHFPSCTFHLSSSSSSSLKSSSKNFKRNREEQRGGCVRELEFSVWASMGGLLLYIEASVTYCPSFLLILHHFSLMIPTC
jgi:hypothetical protein